MTRRRPPTPARPGPPGTERRAAPSGEDERPATAQTARVNQAPEVRVALDALRHIVRALRGSRPPQARHALGSAQLFALQEIAEHPGSSVNDIAALTCTHQSSVSVVIQRLVQQGLVAKVAATGDRRRQRLAVTASGRRLLRHAPAAAQGDLIAALEALPVRERKAFAQSLRTVARLVTPLGTGSHPPMFFEDHPKRGRPPSPGGPESRSSISRVPEPPVRRTPRRPRR